jgi:MFS transporter, DHA1 family, solute carrier family 18 (vesicular amine transporter), member 1/2
VVVEDIQTRTANELAVRPRLMLIFIAFVLFTDYFCYGLFYPLTAYLPLGPNAESRLVLLYGVYAVSVLVVTPVFGYFGDRIGGRATMLSGLALGVCSTALLALAPSFPLLVLAKFCQGAASAALWTAGLALIANHFAAKRVEMLGYAFAGGTFGSVLGPIAGGFLSHALGAKTPYLITCAMFAVAAALTGFFLPASRAESKSTVAFHSLLLNREILSPALAVAMAAFSLGILEPLLPARLKQQGATSVEIGVIFTVAALVYGLSAPLIGRVAERMPMGRMIVLGVSAMAVMLPLFAAFHNVTLTCIGLSLVNVSYAFMLNPASAELGNVVDRSGMSCYSAVYAVYNICYSIGMLATALLASAAARLLNFWGVLLCAGAILLLSVPILAKMGASPGPDSP